MRKIAALFSLLFLMLIISTLLADTSLDQADQIYYQGTIAETIREKNDRFNQALALYTSQQAFVSPGIDLGKLYYNIGNNYFQLGEYAWAILYYYKAQTFIPRDPFISKNLVSAQDILSLPHTSLNAIISLDEAWLLWIILSCLTFLFFSLLLWKASTVHKYAAGLSLLSWSLLLFYISFRIYFSPIMAVIVDRSLLYRFPGEQQPAVNEIPLSPGSLVKITGSEKSGEWLKVRATDGRIGFLPNHSIRLIE